MQSLSFIFINISLLYVCYDEFIITSAQISISSHWAPMYRWYTAVPVYINLPLYITKFLSLKKCTLLYLWHTTQVRHTQHVGFMLYLLSSSLSIFLQLFLIEAFMLYPTNWHNSFIWSIASYISLFIDFLVPMALINMKTAKWYLISLLCYILYFKILFWPIKFPFYLLLAGYFSLFFLVLFFSMFVST